MCRLMPSVMLDLVHTSLLHHSIVGVLPRWTWAGKDTLCMPGVCVRIELSTSATKPEP